MEKSCKKCNESKDVSLFGMSKSKAGNMIYVPYCKQCRAAKGREERKSRVHKVCEQCGCNWKVKAG